MITDKEKRDIREYYKQFLVYSGTRRYRDRSFGTYMYEWHKDILLRENELDAEYLAYKEAFYHSWMVAEKCFCNANAAEISDVEDNVREAIHTLRLKRKEAPTSYENKAYREAIDILKELQAKLPKRKIRI